jgi:hypothetical protein
MLEAFELPSHIFSQVVYNEKLSARVLSESRASGGVLMAPAQSSVGGGANHARIPKKVTQIP